MHEQWQDLIPYYVAGSLSRTDAAALERHVEFCAPCRKALDEWRVIGRIIKAEANLWAKPVPPLSASVRTSLPVRPSVDGETVWPDQTQPMMIVRGRSRGYPARTRSWGAMTLAAAVLTVFVIGGLLVFMATRPERTLDANATHIALLSTITSTPGSEESLNSGSSVQDPDLGILPPGTPSPGTTTGAPAQLPTQPATRTPPPVSPRSMQVVVPAGICSARSATGQAVNIYNLPGTGFDLRGTMDPQEYLEVWQKNGAGWYMVVGADGYIAGWVSGDEVTLYGPCDSVPLPTPEFASTLTPVPPGCFASAASGVEVINMRSGPGNQYDVLNAFGSNESAEVISRSDNGWYRIRYLSAGASWVGWATESEIILNGQCETLPVVAADGYPGETVPVMATPTAVFNNVIGIEGFTLMTTEDIGDIPANTRVRVSYARFTGTEWVYFVYTEDGGAGMEVFEWQLTYAPDTTPFAATPMAKFNGEIGMNQFNVITVETVGNIPANTRVMVSSARYNGNEWIYTIIAEDTQIAAEALESQLTWAPWATPGAPTPTATLSS